MNTQQRRPRLICTADAAILIGVTDRCVLQMIADGRLVAQRIGRRAWGIDRKSAEKMRDNPAKMGRPRRILEK